MKKRIEKEDETTKQINQIHNILDKNYFDVNTKITEENKIEWTVYYCNLKSSDYYSGENRPLLTSRRNTVQDIYKLKEAFEKLKNYEEIRNTSEIFHDSFTLYRRISTNEKCRNFRCFKCIYYIFNVKCNNYNIRWKYS